MYHADHAEGVTDVSTITDNQLSWGSKQSVPRWCNVESSFEGILRGQCRREPILNPTGDIVFHEIVFHNEGVDCLSRRACNRSKLSLTDAVFIYCGATLKVYHRMNNIWVTLSMSSGAMSKVRSNVLWGWLVVQCRKFVGMYYEGNVARSNVRRSPEDRASKRYPKMIWESQTREIWTAVIIIN